MKLRILIIGAAIITAGLAVGLQSTPPTVAPGPAAEVTNVKLIKPTLDPGATYPAKWADPPLDSVMDDWLMWNRECVSYTAFKVASAHGFQVYGWNDANDWNNQAVSLGVPTGADPRPGAVGIAPNAQYGHSVWVEAVNGDGTVTASQYNLNKTGEYSVTREPADAYTYIYFEEMRP